MVGAVGEMAYLKRRKLWKKGEDGLCCSSSAIQTRLGSSSLLDERSEIPIVFVVSFVLLGKRPRYIKNKKLSISMKIGSWILGMRMGSMVYIYFNLVFDKGHKGAGGSPCPLFKDDIRF